MLDKIKLLFKQKNIHHHYFVAIIAVGVLLFLFVPTYIRFAEERSITRNAEQARVGLEKDAQYLLEQARELDQGQIFDINIQELDIVHLISQGIEETRKRKLGGLLIADKNGTVLS